MKNPRSLDSRLFPVESSGVSVNKTLRKIAGFSALTDGWHFGQGAAPSKWVSAIANAIASFALYCGIAKTDAFPGKNGEITVALYAGEDDHSFQIQNDLTVAYWIENDPTSDLHEKLSMQTVLNIIRTLTSNTQWNLSSTSTSGIGTRQKAISEVRLSKTPAMIAGSLAYRVNAQFSNLDAFAPTHTDFTRLSAQNRPSSGVLTNQSFLAVID